MYVLLSMNSSTLYDVPVNKPSYVRFSYKDITGPRYDLRTKVASWAYFDHDLTIDTVCQYGSTFSFPINSPWQCSVVPRRVTRAPLWFIAIRSGHVKSPLGQYHLLYRLLVWITGSRRPQLYTWKLLRARKIKHCKVLSAEPIERLHFSHWTAFTDFWLIVKIFRVCPFSFLIIFSFYAAAKQIDL